MRWDEMRMRMRWEMMSDDRRENNKTSRDNFSIRIRLTL